MGGISIGYVARTFRLKCGPKPICAAAHLTISFPGSVGGEMGREKKVLVAISLFVNQTVFPANENGFLEEVNSKYLIFQPNQTDLKKS